MKRYNLGYTLLELMIALTIGGILMAAAAPSMRNLILNSQRTSHINTLVSLFHYARSNAVKERNDTVICISGDGEVCNRGSDWETGWLIYADRNRNRIRDINEPILYRQGPLEEPLTLTYRAFGSTSYVVFYPYGDSRTNGTFTLCDERGPDYARAMILYKTGRVRTSDHSASGGALSCPA